MSDMTRVLIVEDVPTDVEIVEREVRLSFSSCEFLVVEKQDPFLDALRSFQPDIILSDFKLPTFDGLTALKLAQEYAPETPFIILTGSMNEDTAVECMRTGAWDYVIKEHLKRLGPAMRGAFEQKALRAEKRKAREALKESERRYRLLADNTLDVIWQMDLDLRFTYVNPAIARLAGYTVDEWIGTRLRDHCDDENFMKLTQVISEEIVKGPEGSGTVFEAVMLNKDREPIHLEIRGGVLFSEDGKPTAFQGIARDVTERKRMEEELRAHRKQLQTIFETSPAGIFLVNPEGIITFANKKMGALFSVPCEDFPGTPYVELVHPAQRSTGYGKMKALMCGEIDHVSLERRYQALDGREFVGHLSGRRIFKEDDTLEGLVGIITDITDRKRAEEALKDSEERFRHLAGVTFEGIGFHDKGILLEANEQFFAMLGYEPDELIGSDVIEKTVSPEYMEIVRGHVASRSAEPYEIVALRKDGGRLPLEVRVKLLRIGEKEIRAVALRDLSERKEMERQLLEAQKMEAVGTLAGGIAHDFNNILHIISGHAELLQMELAVKGMRLPETDAIREAALRGADLVKQILTFSRRVSTKFQLTNLNEVVEVTDRLLYRTIPKMIDIELKLEETLKPIRADSTQVEQLLINLALNARDAMPEGGSLVIETRNVNIYEKQSRSQGELKAGQYVLLRVSDSGHGMNDDVIQRIFEPFFTTKGLADGTGLGLSAVFGIVKMHGGHITCRSEVGQGTIFDIHFPVAEPAETTTDEAREVDTPAGGTETILVVDDESLIADLAKQMLEQVGYSVITAGSGEEALDIYFQQKSDIALVILDLIMPGIGGKQCLEELLKIDPQVKALIASGFDGRGDLKRFLDREAKGIVAKPFEMRELLRSVRHVLDGV